MHIRPATRRARIGFWRPPAGRRLPLTTAVAASVVCALTAACATKQFTRSEVGQTAARVDALAGAIEESQERLRQTEARIGAVDAKASAASTSAQQATQAAQQAMEAAQRAAADVAARVEERLRRLPGLPPPPPLPPKMEVQTRPGTGPRPVSAIDAPKFATLLAGLEAFRSQLFEGHFGLTAPQKMTVGDSGDVRLVVSLSQAAEELQEALRQMAAPGDVRAVERLNLSEYIAAKLTGADFQIDATGSEQQFLTLEDDAEWLWRVRALTPGVGKLTVTLTAILKVDGSDRTKDVKVLTKEIDVAAAPAPPRTWGDAATDFWDEYHPTGDFLWGTVVAGVIAALWRWLSARRNKASPAV